VCSFYYYYRYLNIIYVYMVAGEAGGRFGDVRGKGGRGGGVDGGGGSSVLWSGLKKR
jgi:uncharacterized membrane protein YgcG